MALRTQREVAHQGGQAVDEGKDLAGVQGGGRFDGLLATGRLHLGGTGDTVSYPFHCDRIACHDGTLLACSIAGPTSPIKAMRAALCGEGAGRVWFTWEEPREHGYSGGRMLQRDEGYTLAVAKLGYSLWHMVAISRRPGFMPCIDEEALWQAVYSTTTTPVLREWLPHLAQQLRDEGLLKDAVCYGCNSGLLLANSEDLDKLVSRGLEAGELTIRRK